MHEGRIALEPAAHVLHHHVIPAWLSPGEGAGQVDVVIAPGVIERVVPISIIKVDADGMDMLAIEQEWVCRTDSSSSLAIVRPMLVKG